MWLQFAHPGSPLYWSMGPMGWANHLYLPEQEADLPAGRFRPGSKGKSKSAAQVSFPVYVIWQVC